MKTTTLLSVAGGLGLFLAGIGVGHTIFSGAPHPVSNDLPASLTNLGSSAASAMNAATGSTASLAAGTGLASRLQAAVAIRDYFGRGLAIHEIAQQLDEAGVRQALEISGKFNAYARTWVRPRLLSRWLDFDRDAAFAWANQLPKNERDTMLREFYQTLALKIPTEALRFLEQQKTSSQPHSRFSFEVFDVWAANDSLAAADAAARLTDQEERNRATQIVLRRIAQQNPAEAITRMAALPEGERFSAVSSIFGAWAARDPDAAWEGANALKSRSERSSAFGSILTAIAQADGPRAVELAQNLPGEIRLGVIGQAIAQMYDNPEVAAELILMLPSSRQIGHTSGVANRLAESSTSKALEWAQKISNQHARETAIRSIAQSSNLKDPKLVLDFLERFRMKVSSVRENAFTKWASDEPEAATAWMNRLPESEEKDSLRQLGFRQRGRGSACGDRRRGKLDRRRPDESSPTHRDDLVLSGATRSHAMGHRGFSKIAARLDANCAPELGDVRPSRSRRLDSEAARRIHAGQRHRPVRRCGRSG